MAFTSAKSKEITTFVQGLHELYSRPLESQRSELIARILPLAEGWLRAQESEEQYSQLRYRLDLMFRTHMRNDDRRLLRKLVGAEDLEFLRLMLPLYARPNPATLVSLLEEVILSFQDSSPEGLELFLETFPVNWPLQDNRGLVLEALYGGGTYRLDFDPEAHAEFLRSPKSKRAESPYNRLSCGFTTEWDPQEQQSAHQLLQEAWGAGKPGFARVLIEHGAPLGFLSDGSNPLHGSKSAEQVRVLSRLCPGWVDAPDKVGRGL